MDYKELCNYFLDKTYTNGTYSLKYRLYVPNDLKSDEMIPLFIFMHGYGERGNDNYHQFKHGIWEIFNEKNITEYRAIYLAPQCPNDDTWVSVTCKINKAYKVNEENFTQALKAVFSIIDELINTYNIDKDKISVTGLSMGGAASLEMVARRPGFFKACAAVCAAGAPLDDLEAFKDTKIWLFHGLLDTTVLPEWTIITYKSLKAIGCNVKLTTYPHDYHDSWIKAYNEKDILKFLLNK